METRYAGNEEMKQLVEKINSCVKGLKLEDISYDYAFGLTLHFGKELMIFIYNPVIYGREDGCGIDLEQMVDLDTNSERLVSLARAEAGKEKE